MLKVMSVEDAEKAFEGVLKKHGLIGKNAAPAPQVKKEAQPSSMDIKELMRLRPELGSKANIYKKVSKEKLPCFRMGKSLWFELDKVDKWLLTKRR